MGAADCTTVGVEAEVKEPLVVGVPVLTVVAEPELAADAVLALAPVLAAVTTGIAAAAAAIEALRAPNPITLAATDASLSRANRRLAAATLLARPSVISLSLMNGSPGW
jgi:hypothetical protein